MRKQIIQILSLTAALSFGGTAAIAADLTLRKNAVDLSEAEKQDLVDAIYTLKNTVPEGSEISIYDQFVAVHVGAMSLIHRHEMDNHQMHDDGVPDFSPRFDYAHGNSSFLPWHREYILRFEEALQSVSSDVTLPYWDWTQAEALDTIFQPDFLGTNGAGIPVELPVDSASVPGSEGALSNLGDDATVGTLTDLESFLGGPSPESLAGQKFEGGPIPDESNFSIASGWVLNEELNVNPETGESLGNSLVRFLQVPPAVEYPLPPEQIERVQALDDYLLYRPALEGYITVDEAGNIIRGGFTHNYIHALIGGAVIDESDPNNIGFDGLGTMSNVPSSPYDPAFWLHHTNVDRLWAEWQADGHAGSEYYPSAGQPDGHNLNDSMWPWDGGERLAAHTLSNQLDALLPLLPEFDADDVVRPADVLDHQGLGYTYDTVLSSAASQPVSEPAFTPGIIGLGAVVLLWRRRKGS